MTGREWVAVSCDAMLAGWSHRGSRKQRSRSDERGYGRRIQSRSEGKQVLLQSPAI